MFSFNEFVLEVGVYKRNNWVLVLQHYITPSQEGVSTDLSFQPTKGQFLVAHPVDATQTVEWSTWACPMMEMYLRSNRQADSMSLSEYLSNAKPQSITAKRRQQLQFGLPPAAELFRIPFSMIAPTPESSKKVRNLSILSCSFSSRSKEGAKKTFELVKYGMVNVS